MNRPKQRQDIERDTFAVRAAKFTDERSLAYAALTCMAIALAMRLINELAPSLLGRFTDEMLGGAFFGILLQAVFYLVWKKG